MHSVQLQVPYGSQFQMDMVQTNLREQYTRQYLSANITFRKFLLCPKWYISRNCNPLQNKFNCKGLGNWQLFALIHSQGSMLMQQTYLRF